MTAALFTHKSISGPVYEGVIRRGGEILWKKEFRSRTPQFVAYAETQRKLCQLQSGAA